MVSDVSILTDYAYREILRMILSAEIGPGTRIREDSLAQNLGVSRTPVREAVNRLTQNGFVTNVKRKGLYCVKVTRQDLLDLLELRIVLETLSLEKCIDIASNDDIGHFQTIIDNFYTNLNDIMHKDENIRGKEIALLHNDYDVRFHVGIARISKSARLIQYVSEVENLLLIARQRIYTSDESTKIILRSWEQHKQMLQAIRLRDKLEAKNVLEQHLMLMRTTQVNIENGVPSKYPAEMVELP